MRVHLLAPAGFTREPSGGNVYDRRLRDGLAGLGWDVVAHELAQGEVVVPEGLVLADSLVTSWAAPSLLPVARRVVPLVHLVFGTPGERELLAAATAVVTTSEWGRRELGLPHVHVAPPGVDPVPPRTRVAGRHEVPRLLGVGAVVPDKGYDVLVAALATLTDLPWRCTVVGPLDRDPDFVDALRTAVAGAGLTDRVELAGPVVHEAVGSAYAAADVFVHPSRHETWGMVVAEALAHGLPVIASDVGGVREAASGLGTLVPPGDPTALARALRAWLAGSRPAVVPPTRPRWAHTAAVVSSVLEGVPERVP